MTAVFAIVRALHFAGLMIVFGASAYAALARGRVDLAPVRKRLTNVLGIAALVALATAVLSLGLVTGQMTGYWPAALDITQVSIVAASTFYGQIFLVRVALLLGLVLLSIADTSAWLRAGVAGAALALLGPVSHAAANGGVWWMAMAANDAAHLLCAGFWIGALVVLALLIRARSGDLVIALRIFSGWAMGAVALLVVAGVVNGAAILGQPGITWSAAYLGWLTPKLVLAAVMIALALTNRFGILPGLARGDKESSESLALTVVMELSCAVLILIIVGFLGETAPMAM